jgi:cyclohexanone monooxygenase
VKSALEAGPGERAERYQRAWDSGTIGALSFAFTDVGTDLGANATAAEFVHGKIRDIVADRRSPSSSRRARLPLRDQTNPP